MVIENLCSLYGGAGDDILHEDDTYNPAEADLTEVSLEEVSECMKKDAGIIKLACLVPHKQTRKARKNKQLIGKKNNINAYLEDMHIPYYFTEILSMNGGFSSNNYTTLMNGGLPSLSNSSNYTLLHRGLPSSSNYTLLDRGLPSSSNYSLLDRGLHLNDSIRLPALSPSDNTTSATDPSDNSTTSATDASSHSIISSIWDYNSSLVPSSTNDSSSYPCVPTWSTFDANASTVANNSVASFTANNNSTVSYF